ncbi:MAG: hypothetical protein PHI32_04355 [Dysgonamonadaceae bacterium]|nr:hypothetical protein [Dysgonamonadaceae bacterium]MDD4727240.1 hypothetical protein [Dysgonamonadaceae bacterium]
MSQKCPLCGKDKADKSLFCKECTVKLNSEYEVNIPELKETQDISAEMQSKKEMSDHEEAEVASPKNATSNSSWVDTRNDSQKSYYEIERDKKPKRTRFVLISLFLLAVVLISALYIYNNNVKNANLERSAWEVAQRENSVDAYLTYMDEYPQGKYVGEAQTKMRSLKKNESDAWENLRASENTVEFTDFLQLYPSSPYERKVKNRLDSLLWMSSLKENSSQAYSDYINMSTSGEITGHYIGDAQKRLSMLEQSTPVNEADLENIKTTINGFFLGLSNISHEELSQYLTPIISRFDKATNIPREEMIGQLLLIAAKSDAKSIKFDPNLNQIRYKQMGNNTYEVNVPLQKQFLGTNGGNNQIKGYIVHLKLDDSFQIYSFYETKPYNEAP